MNLLKLFRRTKKVEEVKQDADQEFYENHELDFEDQKFEVGKTIVKLTFSDGEKFNTIIYGTVDQYVQRGNSSNDKYNDFKATRQKVMPPTICNSIDSARDYLRNIYGSELNYHNDPFNVTEIKIGKVVAAKIIKTAKHERTFTVTKVVPKK